MNRRKFLSVVGVGTLSTVGIPILQATETRTPMSNPATNPASSEPTPPLNSFFAIHHWKKPDEPEVSKTLIGLIRGPNAKKRAKLSLKLVNLWLDPKSTTAYSMWQSPSEEVLKDAFASLDLITTEFLHVMQMG